MASTISPIELSPEERRDRLIDAAERYMRGEIDVEAFEDAEREYLPDYRAVVAELMRAGAQSKRRNLAVPRRRSSPNGTRRRWWWPFGQTGRGRVSLWAF